MSYHVFQQFGQADLPDDPETARWNARLHECEASGQQYDQNTDSCYSCDPGWVFDDVDNTCITVAEHAKYYGGSTRSPFDPPVTQTSSTIAVGTALGVGAGALLWALLL